jgi:hypothetical protein
VATMQDSTSTLSLFLPILAASGAVPVPLAYGRTPAGSVELLIQPKQAFTNSRLHSSIVANGVSYDFRKSKSTRGCLENPLTSPRPSPFWAHEPRTNFRLAFFMTALTDKLIALHEPHR